MNPSLTYLVDEICAGVEIYYTGRTGGQYLKTAFILCDDYSELVSKVFLLTGNPQWTDKKPNKHFKNYHDVLREVERVVGSKMGAQLQQVKDLQTAMSNRRTRRNEFFHSAGLLDLSVAPRNCVEALCDLLEYGEILLGTDWRTPLESCRNLATLEIMLQLEKLAFSDPSITPKVNKILQDWPRNTPNNKKKGAHVAEYPEDLHFRLCVTCGGKALGDKLKALMTPKRKGCERKNAQQQLAPHAATRRRRSGTSGRMFPHTGGVHHEHLLLPPMPYVPSARLCR